ncbi:alpha/beta hydrolase [Roseibium salinum]|nr:alpha/beta hydrolase [Roseibium salinum]
MRIAYLDEGEGDPILLIHGFASNKQVNWIYPGWVDLLVKDGRRVIAIDNRGHGDSQKFHDPADYGAPVMAEDARRVLDHLGIERADVMGYSMGARISAFLTLNHPDRVRRAVFSGLGYGMIEGVGDPEPIATALEAERLQDVSDRNGRAFRAFAEQTGSDRRALAACMRSSRQKNQRRGCRQNRAPGSGCRWNQGRYCRLAAEARRADPPHAEVLEIPGRDHMLAVGDKVHKQGVLAFLNNVDA